MSENAKAFRVNFSHTRHDKAGLNCANCHTIRAGASRGGQVTEPQPSMHFASQRSASCAACHNGTKAFGPNDFANCKRCHVGNKFSF
jgi:c(7)-type cytochrome triheme protein